MELSNSASGGGDGGGVVTIISGKETIENMETIVQKYGKMKRIIEIFRNLHCKFGEIDIIYNINRLNSKNFGNEFSFTCRKMM